MEAKEEKSMGATSVYINVTKTQTKNFFFRPGHLLALGNFCRSLSEVLERREERLETLETRD